MVDSVQPWWALITRTLVNKLPRLLVRIANRPTIRVLCLLIHHKLALAILQLRQLAVLIGNVDVVLHVLVLKQELTLGVQVRL